MKADMGKLIFAGVLFAVPGAVAAFYWSRLMSRNIHYKEATENDYIGENRTELPGVLPSFLPLIVPLLLITAKSVCGMIDKGGLGMVSKILYFPGEPVFALFVGVILALLLLKNKSIGSFNSVFSEAIEKAGPVLIIVAAGGMFGMVIKSTGIGEVMGKLFSGLGIGLLVPFLIAVTLKTAQGSSTVAIITTASLISPMSGALGLDSEWGRLLSMLSMGAGSMVVSHANDAYFWVVTNFSDININDMLRVYSTSTIIMGLTVFACVFISSFFLI